MPATRGRAKAIAQGRSGPEVVTVGVARDRGKFAGRGGEKVDIEVERDEGGRFSTKGRARSKGNEPSPMRTGENYTLFQKRPKNHRQGWLLPDGSWMDLVGRSGSTRATHDAAVAEYLGVKTSEGVVAAVDRGWLRVSDGRAFLVRTPMPYTSRVFIEDMLVEQYNAGFVNEPYAKHMAPAATTGKPGLVIIENDEFEEVEFTLSEFAENDFKLPGLLPSSFLRG